MTYQLHIHYRVVSRHHHLYALFQPYLSRYIRRAEVKLWAVVAKEWRVTPSLFLTEHINLSLEAGMRRDRAWLRQYLPTLYVVSLYSPKQGSYVVSCLRTVHRLVEHLNPCYYSLSGRTNAYYLYLLVQAYLSCLYPTCCNSPPALDGEYILYSQKEVAIYVTLWLWDILIYCSIKELNSLRLPIL